MSLRVLTLVSVALVPLLVFVASLTAAVRSQESQSSLKATVVAKLLDTLKLDAVRRLKISRRDALPRPCITRAPSCWS